MEHLWQRLKATNGNNFESQKVYTHAICLYPTGLSNLFWLELLIMSSRIDVHCVTSEQLLG